MIQIIASNPISASSFRRGARASRARERCVPPRVPGRHPTPRDDNLRRRRADPREPRPRSPVFIAGVASAAAIPQSRRGRTPRARPRRRGSARARLPGSRARARITTPGRSPVAIAADFRAVLAAPASASSTRPPRTTPPPAAAFDAALDDLLDAEDEEADASGDDDADASVDASLDVLDGDETFDASSASDLSPKKTAACSAAP